jgi:translation initiation factor 2 beta subunit (eIF-2beta)/eIF-5
MRDKAKIRECKQRGHELIDVGNKYFLVCKNCGAIVKK